MSRALVKMSRRSLSITRMRSLTELYIVSRAPDKIAAVVMSTTGATIAWTAVTAIGFISPAYERGAGQDLLLSAGPSGRYTVPAPSARPAAPAPGGACRPLNALS